MRQLFARALLVSTLSITSFPAYAAPETYQLDPTHTNVLWHANHFGFSTPDGKFANVEGTLTLDEAKPENSKVHVKIATESVLTGNPKFDAHLKNKDFFNVKEFPEAVFVSQKVQMTGKDEAKVEGALTLLGITKNIVLDVKLNKIGEHPMTKKKTAGFSASTRFKRSDFGMHYGIPAVADEVRVTIETEANLASK